MLLIGNNGLAKTLITKFVSWINGLQIVQIKPGRNYSLQDFDNDLRDVMKRAGSKQQKITFIFSESLNLGVAFIEKMNALLASGEVPGLFEGEEYQTIISQTKDFYRNKQSFSSDEEVYEQFTKNVQRNLHVVFTMNPSNEEFSSKATSSPAIFNRCVINWFQDWTQESYDAVVQETLSSF